MDARETEDDRPGTGGPEGMPRWVKVFAIAAAALLLVALAVLLLSGGQHGPARHTSSTGELGVGSATASPAAASGDGADRFLWVVLR